TPEEMAVAETLEAVPAVRRTGIAVAGVIVNRLGPKAFPPGTSRASKTLDPGRAVSLAAAAGLRLDEPAAADILRTAAEGARRDRSAHRMVASLRGSAPLFELPDVSYRPARDRVRALAGSIAGGGAPPSVVGTQADHSGSANGSPARPADGTLDGPLSGARIVV